MRVQVVVSQDVFRDHLDVRASRVLASFGGEVILAQTEPPLKPAHEGQEMEITFLSASGGEGEPPQRMSYVSRLHKIIPAWRPAAGMAARAVLVVSPPSRACRPLSLRQDYRVSLRPEYGVGMQLAEVEGGVVLRAVCRWAAPWRRPWPTPVRSRARSWPSS